MIREAEALSQPLFFTESGLRAILILSVRAISLLRVKNM